MKLNENYARLNESYLFAGIAAKVREYKAAHPKADVVSLGIGDVTRPLTPAVICELQAAAHDMAAEETFRGYGPEQGYLFLREAIVRHYTEKGVTLDEGEIFVGDGAKSDLGNMVELFARSRVLLPDPVYPAYRDVNVMAGNRIHFAEGGKRNGFGGDLRHHISVLPLQSDGRGVHARRVEGVGGLRPSDGCGHLLRCGVRGVRAR